MLYGIIVFLIFTRNRKLAQNVGVMLVTLSICILIIISVFFLKKAGTGNEVIGEKYHPYLQLKPPDPDILSLLDGKKSVKIFCLGGSTTEFRNGKGIGWPDMLEKDLRQIYKTDSVFVFNFGKQWYTTLHSLINFETNLRHHKPDAIIFMHNINDFLHNADFSYLSAGPYRQDYGHFLGPVVNIIKNKSSGNINPVMRKMRSVWYNNYIDAKTIEQDSFPGLEPFTRNINTLIDLALMDSIKVILLSEPNIFSENMNEQTKNACMMVNYEAVGKDKKWGFRTAYEGMKQYNERIKEISETRQIFFIDLEKQIPKSLTYFTDDVHFTDTTFNIISKYLGEEIVRLNIIK